MKFLYETHAHTSDVSRCGKIDASMLVHMYKSCGYSGVVITDHYNCRTFNRLSMSNEEKIRFYLSGYKKACLVAGNDLTILLGMEINFEENSNDYLVYGINEKFLYKYENMFSLGIKKFSEIAKGEGLLIIQAHPFRNNMTVCDPSFIDGIEIYNGNMRHDSRNEIAELWADRFKLFKTAGSDFHQSEDLARGGIYTIEKLNSNDDLIKAIKAGVEFKKTI